MSLEVKDAWTKNTLLELIGNGECEWIEFKENWFERDEVGRYISALSNFAAEIGEDYIRATIPFAYEREFGTSSGEKKAEKRPLRKTDRVKAVILGEVVRNPRVTTAQLMDITGLKKTSVQTYLRELSSGGRIRRKGSKKGGSWEVLP